MGYVPTIKFDKFPKQGDYLGRTVEVCFHYDTSKTISGVVVRDDIESPHETIIQLSDGRLVRGCECQYSLR